MITPWSTNAVEITQNMGITGIVRIEEFVKVAADFSNFDPMLFQKYSELHQEIYTINLQPEPILEIENIAAYNQTEGLALSPEEVEYLNNLATKLNRKLTDSEIFAFSQANSEHCRHKIFNGTFVVDGEEKPTSLFKLIKKTSAENPNDIVSAYKDNVAFIKAIAKHKDSKDENKPKNFDTNNPKSKKLNGGGNYSDMTHKRNEKFILDFLLRLNFLIIDPDEMIFSEQIRLMQSASILISAHGAALSHLVCVPKECKVIELNGDTDVRWHYYKIAQHLGLDYMLLIGNTLNEKEFFIEVERVESAVRLVLE
jgi:hypothetical protein